jgi:ubiquinone/menaquinone biosynthesis C-methylase UbiE
MAPDDTYTHGHHDTVLRSHRWRTVENSAAYLVDALVPGTAVLDVGCGPGTITADIAARVAPGRVVAVDRAAAVIEEAAATCAAAGVTVDCRVGDAYALDVPDATFDVVHAHQVLQHLTDPVAALREWMRVTRPGGVVAARDSDYAAFHWYPEDPRLDRWLELYRAAAYANDAEPDAGRRLVAWAHAAGATDVTATASVWLFASADDRAYWGGMWTDRILESALATQLTTSGLATVAELADISAAFREWSEDPDGWFLVPHGEIVIRV